VLWNDPELNIPWPVDQPLLSAKDSAAQPLAQIDKSKLPIYEG
jgi:dTDP-4-dehydrorhamnose 3,5-epimerase